jgi:Conjugative transposon protein TcpC
MPLLSEREIRVEKDGGVMARRALLERSDQLTADDEALPHRQPHSARPDQVMPHWRGAGGRWLVWVARAIAWAVLLLIGFRGVLAIIQGPGTSPSASSGTTTSSTQFPVLAAQAYALEFGRAYLNFSPASAAARSADLASFLPPGSDRSFGWNGAGTQRLLDEQVAATSVTGRHSALVTLLAQLSDGKLIELSVPIYAANGGMSVSGKPALLPGPAKAAPPAGSRPNSDPATEAALQGQLPAFFRAYASGDRATLARFAARGAHIKGLGGEVSLAAVDSVYVPAGGSTRPVSVTVTWDLASAPTGAESASVSAAPAALEMAYQLTIVRQGGSWDIRSISASTHTLASGSP